MKNSAGTFAIAVQECSSKQSEKWANYLAKVQGLYWQLAVSNKGYFFIWIKKQKLTDQTVFCCLLCVVNEEISTALGL